MIATNSPMLIRYKLEYFDENIGEISEVEGLMAAYSYDQAVRTIESVYGKNNLISIYVCETFIMIDTNELKEEFDL